MSPSPSIEDDPSFGDDDTRTIAPSIAPSMASHASDETLVGKSVYITELATLHSDPRSTCYFGLFKGSERDPALQGSKINNVLARLQVSTDPRHQRFIQAVHIVFQRRDEVTLSDRSQRITLLDERIKTLESIIEARTLEEEDGDVRLLFEYYKTRDLATKASTSDYGISLEDAKAFYHSPHANAVPYHMF